MKSIFLSDDFPPQSFGGAGVSTSELAIGVKKKGHEVYVLTTCRNIGEEGPSDYFGLKVIRIQSDYNGRWRSLLGLYNPVVLRKLNAILQELKPDVVYANNIHQHLS